MIELSFILYLAVLLLVTYQDFSQREISWYTLPLIFLFYFYKTPLSVVELINLSIANVGFVFFVFITTTVYYSIKGSKLINIVNHYLGIGDILFFIVCSFIFDLPNFLLFFISSLVLGIVVGGVLKSRKEQATIPLAGIMSFYLFILSILDKFSSAKLFRNSDWLNSLLVS